MPPKKSNRLVLLRNGAGSVVIDEDLASPGESSSISGVHNVYGTPDFYGRITTWSNKIQDGAEVVEDETTAKKTLIVRNIRSLDSRRPFQTHSVVVQCPYLKDTLREIFRGYRGVTIDVTRLTFQKPWWPFVHRWHTLTKIKDKLAADVKKSRTDVTLRQSYESLVLLHDLLKVDLADIVTTRDDFLQQGVVTYELLWTLFPPDAIVLSGGRAYQVSDAAYHYQPDHFEVTVRFIDWNGSIFGYRKGGKKLMPYSGTFPIRELEIYPLSCHQNENCKRRDLQEAAMSWERLCGFNHKRYDGYAYVITDEKRVAYSVHGRVIIDTASWNLFNADRHVTLAGLINDDNTPREPVEIRRVAGLDAFENADAVELYGVEGDSVPKVKPELTPDQLLIATSIVRGYSLKDKRWMEFETANVSDIVWDKDAFSKLVLPDNHKLLVRAIVESHAENNSYFDDVIQGKGQGMIFLLNGPPGVGKTLTAECVSEVLRVPIYYLSTLEIGTDAATIEGNLTKVLDMVANWKGVLLIDEADVFLEERTVNDLERNKLVSVFLRLLEYYKGILFLTSNRGDTIDPAFHSRIHLRLGYSDLTFASRRVIWKNFIDSIRYRHEFSAEDIEVMSAKQLNGRQIKNLLKTAVLYAAKKQEPFCRKHVELVLEIDPQG